MRQLELIVNHDYSSFRTQFFLRSTDGYRTHIIGKKDGQLVEVNISDPTPNPVEPLLELPTPMAELMIKAFANYAHQQNIRTENENLLKGKLDATTAHLLDMRTFAEKLLNHTIDEARKQSLP